MSRPRYPYILGLDMLASLAYDDSGRTERALGNYMYSLEVSHMKYNLYEAIVWDLRDSDSPEPSSSLGVYATINQAEIEIEKYLETEHGPYIIKTEVREVK
jgi:hypothetical protein